VAKVNLPLPDPRLRLFIEGKEDWLEEGILVPAKKNKRGRIIEEGSYSAQEDGAQQNYVPPFGKIPTPPSYYGGPTTQAWGSGPAIPPQNYVVPNITFAEPYTQYPPIIFCDYLPDHNLSLRMDHQFKDDCKTVPRLKISSISPKEKYFRYLPYLYHLFAQGRANV
jgi:hypothetical protein